MHRIYEMNEEIQENIRKTQEIKKITTPRQYKRAILPSVGRAERWLFGTTTEDQEHELKQLIRIAANDTKALAALLANQTEVVEAEFETAHERIRQLENSISLMNRRSNKIEEQQRLGEAVQALAANILQFQRDVDITIEAILLANEGEIHPEFFPLRKIRESKNLAESTIQEATFPLRENDTSLSSIKKISALTIALVDDKLIYRLNIPLIDRNRFSLYKATPIPALKIKNNLYSYIWPQWTFFAVNTAEKMFIPTSIAEINNCKRAYGDFICRNPEPTRKISINSPCEIKIAQNISFNAQECDIRLWKLDTAFWSRLHGKNTLAYSTPI